MDEQTTQQEQSQQFQQQQVTNQEAEQQDKEEPTLQEDAPQVEQQQSQEEPEIGITEDGEVTFKDGFFGDFSKKAEEDVMNKQPSTPTPQQTTPNYYTDEELQNIPFEQWNKDRLPEVVKSYYEKVARQIERRNVAERMRNASIYDLVGEAPKEYTPKDLVLETRKEAMKKLGLTNEDDFSPDFDEEQRAAMDIARMEILQRRQQEQSLYNQRVAESKELSEFNARLAMLPDFNQFNQWYLERLKKIGKTHNEINMGLLELGQKNGGRAIINEVSSWYNMYKQDIAQNLAKNQQKNTQYKNNTRREQPFNPPLKLESTQGGNTSNRKTYNMRDFGQLDDDAQAQALIDMGIVK